MTKLLSLIALLFLFANPAVAAPEYVSSDDALKLVTNEEFRKTFNPHAVMSLISPYETVIVVTKAELEGDVTAVYDNLPKTLPQGQMCVGKIMLSVDGEQAPSFVVEGMFPPEGEPTHQTLLTVVNRGKHSYNIMIHYPLDDTDGGLEFAHELLSALRWLK